MSVYEFFLLLPEDLLNMKDSKPRILFVDDEPNHLSAVRRSLRNRRNQWDMVFVESGEEAMATCKESLFHVVVTDLKMPGMNGIEVVKAVNRHSTQTSCIMLTGTADPNTATELINSADIFRRAYPVAAGGCKMIT